MSKATGYDGISQVLLKEAASSIAPSLTRLFNSSLNKRVFPSAWKQANITPIFKGGDASLCSNYRPISLLSCVAKVFERAVFKYVFNFFRDSFALTDKQSGFMPGDGTINQLIFLYNEFAKAIDMQKEVRVIFCDITKAFDKVYHPALLYKLRKKGISGYLLDWFGSYLSDRRQRVVMQGEFSDWGRIEAGVPQGSVLGPLLFLVYVNDIVDIVSSNIRLYADDVTLYITIDDPTDSAATLNDNLNHIENWSKQWLVTFNSSKTKSMIISKKRQRLQHFPIQFQGTALQDVSQQKHLGLIFSADLSWSPHINFIVSKARKLIGVMRLLQYRLSRRTLELIYLTYIRPILEYGDVVWGGCTQCDADLLEGVQLAAARAVTGATCRTSHAILYNDTGWETLSRRREKHRLILLYKIINGHTPEYLCDLIPGNVSSRNSYNVRSKHNISQIRTRSNIYHNSFIPATIRQWNLLPSSVRNSDDIDSFKGKLDKGKPKTNELFYIGNRKANILHAKLRMGCSQLNNDMHKIGIVSSPACACGAQVETSFHYFFECGKYVTERDILHQKIISIAPFTLQTLMFGSKRCSKAENRIIFESTQTYILNTNRFK